MYGVGDASSETRIRKRVFQSAVSSAHRYPQRQILEYQGLCGGLGAQSMNAPPLTFTASPVMKLARGEARKSTTRATSSGVSRRPRGVSAM